MVKCSIAKTLTMKHFTGFQDMLFYSCPVPPEEREKLDAFLLLLEKSNAWKYLNGCNTKVEPGRPKIDECKLFAAMLYCFVLGKASLSDFSQVCERSSQWCELRYSQCHFLKTVDFFLF